MMIFDSFPRPLDAYRFVGAVQANWPELGVRVYDDEAEAQAADPFPGRLSPPVVHVERAEPEVESSLTDKIVLDYGGRFVGT